MENIKERINNYWSSRAKEFSVARRLDLVSSSHDIWIDIIKKHLPKKDKLKALDLGTGAGFFAFLLNELGVEVVGIDYSLNMIKEANINKKELGVEEIVFKQMDATNLDFDNATFDFIISRNVTWTLEDPKKAYEEMVRVLKKDGKILNCDASYGKAFKNMDEEAIKKSYEAQKESPYKRVLQTVEQMKERNEIATSLYICEKERPGWDVNVLLNLGINKIEIDTSSFIKKLDGHNGKMSPYGMFMLVATK